MERAKSDPYVAIMRSLYRRDRYRVLPGPKAE
jgi:hypothetical protein